MKRLPYTLLLPVLLLLTSCRLDTFSRITDGVKMIGNYCKNFAISNKKIEIPGNIEKEEDVNSVVYPFNIWDPKMLIR